MFIIFPQVTIHRWVVQRVHLQGCPPQTMSLAVEVRLLPLGLFPVSREEEASGGKQDVPPVPPERCHMALCVSVGGCDALSLCAVPK